MDLTTRQKVRVSDADAAQERPTCMGAGQPISRFKRPSVALSASGRELAEISGAEPFDRSPLRIRNVTDGKEIATIQLPTDHEHWNFSTHQKWQYAGGGNDAQWSPDGSQIVWTTARDLAPLGKIHVWVSHLVVLNVASLTQQPLTSGISNESEFFWCSR
jgi:hypothetical protein